MGQVLAGLVKEHLSLQRSDLAIECHTAAAHLAHSLEQGFFKARSSSRFVTFHVRVLFCAPLQQLVSVFEDPAEGLLIDYGVKTELFLCPLASAACVAFSLFFFLRLYSSTMFFF